MHKGRSGQKKTGGWLSSNCGQADRWKAGYRHRKAGEESYPARLTMPTSSLGLSPKWIRGGPCNFIKPPVRAGLRRNLTGTYPSQCAAQRSCKSHQTDQWNMGYGIANPACRIPLHASQSCSPQMPLGSARPRGTRMPILHKSSQAYAHFGLLRIINAKHILRSCWRVPSRPS